ncbi:2-C-methyl-D-erythritol 4-phosphate cytidylyltransferase [Polynucleobacter sp. JS-Polo-80-F4]|uniref:2-C-methyl-D-erythritol 4-phosphate cytidylyltransferase n=1 Tax=Polynucleobacter sp. JS-Polo-80-F4 TaxID=2576918 RepID=UPI001C0DB3FA|nr:2-C-methyl-D-erythritol 4-phosphate cytidylyltransferase [Polynucleobacter sp. JS-Polo-80-F4]MBU3617414.1 2-C-methyl-D-erythritol 4-phosphate cytidylyltransferase [Polynucleobacter sp. JS-Polo-80-F4]
MGSGKHSNRKCHTLLPTAGTGSRLGGDLPKQFQQLAGMPMVSYALEAFKASAQIQSIWIGVSPSFIENPILRSIANIGADIHVVPTGGPTRQETVRNTLAAMMQSGIPEDDWILVHDAARPGITPTLINKLIDAVKESHVGGILAVPLADTLKQADLDSVVAGNIPHSERTIPREHLWQAQTPQMFGLKQLHDALENAIRLEADVTDEASAIELTGAKPLLIEGAARNFKVTHPADWELMQLLLTSSVN